MVVVQWSDSFLIWAVYAIVAVVVKPIIGTWLPQSNPYQNNMTRLCGFIVAYVLTLANHAVAMYAYFTWSQAWGLIPVAAGVYALAALTYHITDDGTVPAPPQGVTPTPPAPPVTPVTPVQPTLAPAPTPTRAPAPAPQRNAQGRSIGKVTTSSQQQTVTMRPASQSPVVHPWPAVAHEGDGPDQNEKGS